MNNFSVVGRIGQDATVRQAGNSKVTSFSLAWTSPFGEKNTTWFNVSYFGDRGEKLSGYLTKGKQVGVTGQIELRKYTTKDGQERQSLELRANDISFVGSRDDNAGSGSTQTTAEVEDNDSVPF